MLKIPPLVTIALEAGLLKSLPLEHGASKFVNLYIMLTDEDGAGPATLAMAKEIRNQVEKACGSA